MTKEERELALYCLKASSDYHSEVCEECINYPNCDHTGQDDVTETIIKALEQEPCEDCISRQAVLDTLMKCEEPCEDRQDFYLDSTTEFEEKIKELPPVNPKQKIGHWIKSSIGGAKICSICQAHMGLSSFKFCPNCGAKMESEG